MNRKTLFELEFYRIRDEISHFCSSEEGRYTLSKIEPLKNIAEIEDKKNLGREMSLLLDIPRSSPILAWPEVHGIIQMLKVSGVSITLEQAKSLLLFCISIKKIKETIKNASLNYAIPNLMHLTDTIPDVSPVESEISKVITIDGQIKDLPSLREIHTKIASLKSKIRASLTFFTSNTKYLNILEANVPVLRGGRQMLAVKAQFRSSIPGIIYDVSSSGQTAYIEPEESVRYANELVEAEAALQAEIKRILAELAQTISPHSINLQHAIKIMQNLDVITAAAKWGKSNEAIYADECKNDEPLFILGARHPILGEKAVPIDIRFVQGKKVLIITGPNTGGKTVALKTVALFAMMNQCAFPVPAKEETRLPIFNSVFSDIGDEQSLDESLSTFSGHIKNIANAVKNADEKSLVLLDELGSGTDPQEGAAISLAALDALLEKKALVLITTHQGVIKNYGYTHSECINASVEFNAKTLTPSYRIVMGVPGESHALDIAKKAGLPKKVIECACRYLASEQADVSSLIRGLSEKNSEADKLLQEIACKEQEINDKIRKNDLKSLALRQKELELKKERQQESYKFLSETRKQLENLVRVLREGEITREKTLSVRNFISDLTNHIEENEKSIEKEETAIAKEENRLKENGVLFQPTSQKEEGSHKKSKKKRIRTAEALATAQSYANIIVHNKQKSKTHNDFSVGATVSAGKSNQIGTIISKIDDELWSVQFGSIRMPLKQKDLTFISQNESRTPSYTIERAEKQDERPVFELRLLGMRAEEALRALEKQIDRCVMQDFKNFSIIHGTGAGVLQQKVRDYLSNCRAVKDFEFAHPEDGGFGKTYVTLH